MRYFLCWFIFCLVLNQSVVSSAQQAEQENPSIELTESEKNLVEVARKLSATTLVDGPGWQAYQEFLHKDFDRWSAGQGVWDRAKTVDAIRGWWEAGNRMSSSNDELISVQINGTCGIVRKEIHESYVDDDGNESGEFRGFVTQVWLLDNGRWRLLTVTIQRAAEQ